MKRFIIIVVILLFFITETFSQKYLTVYNGNDSGLGSLRYCIELASPGDTIIFNQNVTEVILTSGELFIDKSITIKSENERVTISRSQLIKNLFRIFKIENSLDEIYVTLSNLEISCGETTYDEIDEGHGGGIYINTPNGTIIIEGCHIMNNHSAALHAKPLYFADNGGSGGGIYINEKNDTLQMGNCLIKDCIIQNNKTGDGGDAYYYAGDGGHGGGIYIGDLMPVTIENTIIQNNSTGEGGSSWIEFHGCTGSGSGILSRGIILNLLNCLVTHNTIGDYWDCFPAWGGGIVGYSNIINSTICYNCQDSYQSDLPLYGGGVCACFSSAGDTTTIRNSIISNNYAFFGPDIAGCAYVSYSLVKDSSYCLIFGDQNLYNTDPSLIDSVNDFQLNFNSPCINAGDPDTSGLTADDLNGDPRIVNDRVDMGAYEYQFPLYIAPIYEKGDISIYPNPNRGILYIFGNLSKLKEIHIIDTKGNILVEFQKNIPSMLNLQSIPSGFYVIHILTDTKTIVKKLIIIK